MGSWPNNSTCRRSGCRQLSNASGVWYSKYFMFSDLAGRNWRDLLMHRVQPISPVILFDFFFLWETAVSARRGAFGVMSHHTEQCITILEWGSWKNNVQKSLKKKSCSKSVALPSRRHRRGGGSDLTEKRGLSVLSVKPCGCFPSSAVSPELLRLVSCRADRVSRQASWVLLLSAGGSRGL